MRNPKVAHRYAKSLLGLASERKVGEEVEKDLRLIDRMLTDNRELKVFLHSPVVKSAKKNKVLEALLQGNVSELTLAFIRILTSKGREMLLPEIVFHYLEQSRHQKGIVAANVTSASPLAEDDKARVAELLRLFNHDGGVELTETVDPEIIGGFILKVEDRMVDASVSSQLRRLRREFTENLYEASL